MDTLDRVIQRLMLLILVLILVSYYQGATNIIQALGSGVGSLVQILQGRTSSGAFAGYPQGG